MRIPHLRWWIAGLLFFSTVINYIDRQTLSVLAPVITREMNISPTEYSNILTAFLAAYTVMFVGSGFVVDRWGSRVSLAVFVVWWSLANMAHAFSRGVWSLGLCRLLLGLGESGNFMAAFRAVSEWYPARERAFVNGLIQAGTAVGAILAPPVITWIQAHYGWRQAFVFSGGLGLVWVVFWWALYHPPEQHPRITDAEKAWVQEKSAVPAVAENPAQPMQPDARLSWRQILRYRQTWGLLLSRFLSDPVWWFYLFWLPKYLSDQRGFSMAEIGMLAWMPYLAADVGALVGGWISGRLVAAGRVPVSARCMVMLPCALVMPLSLVIHSAQSRPLLIALVCVITFSHMAWKTNQTTLTNDVFPKHLIGASSGLLAFGNGLGGTLFTWMTGPLVQKFGYGSIFLIMSVLHPLSYLLMRRLVREPLRV
jgi:ACS family hexuronate transporter-like MFS transporter